ncbi:MAG: hypothetical protein KGD64_12415 [Candidatus Heimdallarchaeota archaeon]|nr:hypothetical protein [Candidatus Heimdallarchaeota archaeon]
MIAFHVVGDALQPLKEPYVFLKGDVCVIQTSTKLWIWVGSKSFVDDKFVGAWTTKQIHDEQNILKTETIFEGEEPENFKKIVKFTISEGDTPRILKRLNKLYNKDYRILQIKENEEGEITSSEIPFDYKLFKSDDTYVIDAYNQIYVWIGKNSQVKEKYEAGRITRALEVDRKRIPLIYVIEEEDEPKGFRDMIYKLALRDGVQELRRTVSKEEESKSKWWQFWKK